MQKRTVIFLVVLTLIVSASIAVAMGPRGGAKGGCAMGGPGACPMMGGRLVAELGLTDAQLAQMRELQKEYLNLTQATRDQIMAKVKEMAKLWAVEDPDAGQIKAAAADIDGLRAELRNTGIDYLIKGLGILTPQQREKLRTMIQNRPEWCPCPGCPMGMGGMGCGMGFGMGGGMGCGMGSGMGMGNATGPRAKMGTCPLAK